MPILGNLISDPLRIFGNRSVTQPPVTPPSNRALILVALSEMERRLTQGWTSVGASGCAAPTMSLVWVRSYGVSEFRTHNISTKS